MSVAIGAQVLARLNDVDRAVTNYVEWADLAWAHCDNLGVDKLEMIGAEEVAPERGDVPR